MNYQLTVIFSMQDLAQLMQSGYALIIGKSYNGSSPNIAWVVIQQLQTSNVISWNDDYGLYMSNSPIMNGSTIQVQAETPGPAAIGALYLLDNMGNMTLSQGGGTAGSYSLQNNGPQAVTAGLMQNVNANGSNNNNISSALALAPQATAVMPASGTIFLWVAQMIQPGTVTNPPDRASAFTFGGGVNQMPVMYNGATGTFGQEMRTAD